MIAAISLGDYVGIAGLIALTGGQVVVILQARRNGHRVEEVHTRMGKVEQQLQPPSGGTLAAQMEGISQSFHVLAQLYEDSAKARSRRSGDDKEGT